MEPAYPLVLTNQEHALIGELVEIMGLADDIMIRTVARLLNVDRPAANKIMGSTNVRDNAAIWAHAIRNRINNPKVAAHVAIAEGEMKDIAEIRNDFIHALFTGDYAEPGYMAPGYQTTSATRIKSGKTRPTSELQAARDRAATLSCLIAHIDHCTLQSGDRGPSPWLEKLGPLLQTHRRSRSRARPDPRQCQPR